jgi:hypothetical protein
LQRHRGIELANQSARFLSQQRRDRMLMLAEISGQRNDLRPRLRPGRN